MGLPTPVEAPLIGFKYRRLTNPVILDKVTTLNFYQRSRLVLLPAYEALRGIDLRKILEIPELYHLYQVGGGFFGARLKAFKQYIDFNCVDRIFDIGCGPGHIVNHIPAGIDYIGFDTEQRYIDFANKKFGGKGRFVLRNFEASVADDYGQPDIVLMNGVLHHLDDALAGQILRSVFDILPASGMIFALDGCFKEGQNVMSRALIKGDRGRHVRTARGYADLLQASSFKTDIAIRDDFSWVPYTFAVTRGFKADETLQSALEKRLRSAS